MFVSAAAGDELIAWARSLDAGETYISSMNRLAEIARNLVDNYIVDNVLRPILVGKDTRMPDYLVLVATLGGIVVFGLNGFVIGPVIAAMFLVSWDMLATVRANNGS